MAEDGIDWSFFSMARYLAAADLDGGRALTRGAWDGFLDRLAEAGRLVGEHGLDEQLRQVTRPQRS